MTGELLNRVALVTGASRGIGAACARALAREGAKVALAARTTVQLERVAQEIGTASHIYEVDLGDRNSTEGLVQAVNRDFGEVDILVNNAGISLSKPIEKLADDDFESVLRVNLLSVMRLCTEAVKSMRRKGAGGSIVNISSCSALVGTPYLSAYGASKAAVDGLTRSLACELGPENIRVNSVLPGFVDTDIWNRGRQIPGLPEHIEGMIALRRWGTPDEIADVVAFLCSSRARYVTGVSLLVDGGFANMAEVLPRRH